VGRKNIPKDIRLRVLHEGGYKCGNPVCRTFLTLDVHHLDPVSQEGKDTPDNLIALCPNCHSMHHKGHIPIESIRAWKLILVAINDGLDKQSIDLLLTIGKFDELYISGEGMFQIAPLVANNLVKCHLDSLSRGSMATKATYKVKINENGINLIDAWRKGDQARFVGTLSSNNT